MRILNLCLSWCRLLKLILLMSIFVTLRLRVSSIFQSWKVALQLRIWKIDKRKPSYVRYLMSFGTFFNIQAKIFDCRWRCFPAHLSFTSEVRGKSWKTKFTGNRRNVDLHDQLLRIHTDMKIILYNKCYVNCVYLMIIIKPI